MIDQENTNDSSLAFVDVITNGLGGLLVLFFIAVLVQNRLEWSGSSGASSPLRTDEFPFVLIARPSSTDSGECFNASSDIWDISGISSGKLDRSRGKNLDWGVDYAILLASEPLDPARASIRIRTMRSVQLDVEVYPAGARQKTYQVEAEANRWTEVWPRNRSLQK
jgi:hypothetical protein